LAERRRALKVVKALSDLISRPVLDIGFFKKKPMSPKDTVRRCFELMMSEHCWQESPLMNKKGQTLFLSMLASVFVDFQT
jgi:hypothetical protein